MKKLRNILAMLMVFVMLVAVMPMNVFAGTPTTETEEQGKEEPGKEEGKKEEEKKDDEKKEVEKKVEGKKEEEKKDDEKKIVIVKFELNGKGSIEKREVEVEIGKPVAAPNPAPKAEGFIFDGWYEDEKLTKAYKFDTPVTKAITLYAKWTEDKKPDEDKPDTKPGYYKVDVYSYAHGTAKVNTSYAKEGQTITVTATPNAGYAVKNVYYITKGGAKVNLRNNPYNDYYYYGYKGKYYDGYYGYYGDYYRYYSDYEKNYYYDYSSYDAYLKDRHYSFWNNGYRYWDDYDYKYYNRYYDRYYDGYYGYYSDYYRYYDDYVDNYYKKYSSYSDYLYDRHYSHYRDYRYYDKYDYRYYDYRYYNYATTDTFDMPASNVTVYVEFTDWAYYGYYYDDYYYYRYHRNKKDNYYERQKKAEEKAEEEKVVEKTPQVFEASATINVGSNVFTKVNKNVTTKHQMDVAAYVKNGRVMLPLRYVAEALGLQVSWVPETKTVIIWDLTQRVEIPIKSNKIIVNGVTYTSDVKPEINSSRTMLPIANIARALGLVDGSDIIWDPVMKQVKLTRRVISK